MSNAHAAAARQSPHPLKIVRGTHTLTYTAWAPGLGKPPRCRLSFPRRKTLRRYSFPFVNCCSQLQEISPAPKVPGDGWLRLIGHGPSPSSVASWAQG